VASSSSARPSAPAAIRIRGARQNNLQGFDLDIPLGRYVVVTGLSGAGKSSLVFDTLHAEGQRRYVETFSAYTRQFLDLLDKPQVDAVENARPSIAIEQSNTVKTSRSTVGTMTELTDFAKVWFSQVATCHDPDTGEPVEDDTPETIWRKTRATLADATVVVAFQVTRPANTPWPDILASLRGQGYLRVLLAADDHLVARRLDSLDETALRDHAHLHVAQDRLALEDSAHARFLEAVETALHFGAGQVHLFKPDGTGAAVPLRPVGHYSRGLHSPRTGRVFRPATPALFSFNSPLGACPRCRGFGRVIEIDERLAIPDRRKSIDEGALKCWEGEVYGESKKDLITFARRRGIPLDVPFANLTPEHQAFIIDGEPGYGENGREWPEAWYGVKGFFRWLEKNTYKMHVRVFLSRYRAYTPCPECAGTRLQPEALCWRWRGRTLPELYQLPVDGFLALLDEHAGPTEARHSAAIALDSMRSRLRYLVQVGLGYLTLDRTSRTLSGGEVQRVNLTSCLGTSLVDTLFVLDEPSVGLHPRDIDRLIGVIRSLTAAGNTVVVVEHDEAMIRAADHVIEIGPAPGAGGGRVIFQGPVADLRHDEASITGAYLSGRRTIPVPATRRPVSIGPRTKAESPWLRFAGATRHNLHNLDIAIPLQRFVVLSGVSGSGKSTLLEHVIHQGLLARRQQWAEEAAVIADITGDEAIGEVVLVDQSPLSRTPRSNPALYCEAWDGIRELYAREPAALAAGFGPSSFSFNGGDGRCDHCNGLGYERVEMQFLSDVFVPCPVCDGRRFKPEILAITWREKSVADLLHTTVADALVLFADQPALRARLAPLAAVGLDYLTLGQPLNTLSGGEAQRLKLVRFLGGHVTTPSPANRKFKSKNQKSPGSLLLLDEPTTGLHRHDVKRLLEVLQALVERGHSLVIIEHNLDVIKSADWVIEIGPEAGARGGLIVAAGPPEHMARAQTATSPYLTAALFTPTASPAQSNLLGYFPSGTHDGDSAPRGRQSNLIGYFGGERLVAEEQAPYVAVEPAGPGALTLIGAREHNLKNLSLTLPHRELTVVTGVSGSGKSTLAFDIIFAEGQRRFMESMSPYARQFVEQLPRPTIDRLSGIPPTVAIEQRVTRGSRKSTVATITEVAQYLRLLYARLGVQHHPDTDRPVTPLSAGELRLLLARVLRTTPARRARHLYLCAPLVRGRKGHHQPIATWLARHGYELMRCDGQLVPVEAFTKLDRYREHDIEVVVSDLKAPPQAAQKSKIKNQKSSAEPLAEALRLGQGTCFLVTPRGEILAWFSTTRTDSETGESFPELDPKHFSHNSPRGWCPACRGHGRIFDWMLAPAGDEEVPPEIADLKADLADELAQQRSVPCPECHGARLNRVTRAVKLPLRGPGAPLSLPDLLALTPAALLDRLARLRLDARGRAIARDILPQIEERLRFLDHVGLGYLTLDRATATLSGGEAQRIRLAAQLGTNLAGVLYVLDEPSIGLHARDNDRLISTLETLRDKGNSVLVVEHDDELMRRADRIVDLGPGAGVHGGELLALGTPEEIQRSPASLTGLFLQRGIAHPKRGAYRPLPPPRDAKGWIELTGVHFRNLRGFDLRLPRGRLIVVAGPSGAGKSTLFRDVLHPAVTHALKSRGGATTGRALMQADGFNPEDHDGRTAPFVRLRGVASLRSVIEVDQAPIGKTPAPRRRPTSGSSTPSAPSSPGCPRPNCVATKRDAFPSTPPAVVAKPAPAPAASNWKWPSCPTPTCPATTVVVRATGLNSPT
jgi:excinuclease ABC subunit A